MIFLNNSFIVDKTSSLSPNQPLCQAIPSISAYGFASFF